MPYKSDAQRKYMNWAASKGKIKKSIVQEFNKESKGLDLPDFKSPDKIKNVKKLALNNIRRK